MDQRIRGGISKVASRRSEVGMALGPNLDGFTPRGTWVSVSCKGNLENSQVPTYMGDGYL